MKGRFTFTAGLTGTAMAALAIAACSRPRPAAGPVTAQRPTSGGAASAPNVGQVAPDFSLRGSTRFGLLRGPVKLSDFRGQTVVLAFFPKARTKG